MATINALFEFASRILLSLERHFYTYLRIAIFVVMAWRSQSVSIRSRRHRALRFQ